MDNVVSIMNRKLGCLFIGLLRDSMHGIRLVKSLRVLCIILKENSADKVDEESLSIRGIRRRGGGLGKDRSADLI